MKPEYRQEQAELFGLVWRPVQHPFRLCVNDILRIDCKLCRVIRVTESAAVVLMNRPQRVFSTRFDKPVRFQPAPVTFRISANAEVEIVNRPQRTRKRREQLDSPSGKRTGKRTGPTRNGSAMPPHKRRPA